MYANLLLLPASSHSEFWAFHYLTTKALLAVLSALLTHFIVLDLLRFIQHKICFAHGHAIDQLRQI